MNDLQPITSLQPQVVSSNWNNTTCPGGPQLNNKTLKTESRPLTTRQTTKNLTKPPNSPLINFPTPISRYPNPPPPHIHTKICRLASQLTNSIAKHKSRRYTFPINPIFPHFTKLAHTHLQPITSRHPNPPPPNMDTKICRLGPKLINSVAKQKSRRTNTPKNQKHPILPNFTQPHLPAPTSRKPNVPRPKLT